MEEIIDYIRNFEYKKLIYPILIILLNVLGFIYLREEINKKEPEKMIEYIVKNTPSDEVIEEVKYIYIDIKGAVKKPGVYKLETNSRVIDAINISGGLDKNANTTYINLSKILNDSEMIKIYTNDEIKNMDKQEIQKIEECICETQEKDNLVNINTASIDELKTLNGVGDAKAQAIIEYRNNIGLFTKIEDIKQVNGISETIYEKIKDYIRV